MASFQTKTAEISHRRNYRLYGMCIYVYDCVCMLHSVSECLCVAYSVSLVCCTLCLCVAQSVSVVCCTQCQCLYVAQCVIVQLLILFYNYYTFHLKESVSFRPLGHKTYKYNFFSCTPKLPNQTQSLGNFVFDGAGLWSCAPALEIIRPAGITPWRKAHKNSW